MNFCTTFSIEPVKISIILKAIISCTKKRRRARFTVRAVNRVSFFVRKNAPPEASKETGGGRGEEKPKIVLFFRSVVFLFALRICPNSFSYPFFLLPDASGKPTRCPFLCSKSSRMLPFLPVKTFRDSFSSSALDEKTKKIGQKMPGFPLFR